MRLYTWKDIERKLLLNKDKWDAVIADIEVYTDEVIVYLNEEKMSGLADNILSDVLKKNYDGKNKKIILDLPSRILNVTFEIEQDMKKTISKTPLFKNVLYQQSAYYSDFIEKELPGVPVIAFHSYKGGVGRTLSLLAFVKAWSALKNVKNSKRLLIVDADIEAPGITWLTAGQEEAAFSFLDLLEITQEKEDIDEIIELAADKISELTIKIETEKSMVEHVVLPTYRYIEQLMDMYASPESLALSYHKKYILAEVLSNLGKRINAAFVFVDLRAGLSEFSAPLLFDPRVKKYLVTSTSYQSVKGTEILLHQLNKGLPLNGNTKIPEILLTMGQENVNTSDIISALTAVYDKHAADNECEADDTVFVTDDIVTELPFASELVHLESLEKIMKNLNGRDFYHNILRLVQNSYAAQTAIQNIANEPARDEIIKRIHNSAENQITAEGNGALEILMTDSIQNLLKKYKNRVPNTVIMGAKGSGKTFLYREILRNKYWEAFIAGMEKPDSGQNTADSGCMIAVPMLASGTAGGFREIIETALQSFNAYHMKGKIKSAVYIDNKDKLLEYARGKYDLLEWKNIWKKIMLDTFEHAYASLEDLEDDLKKHGIKLMFLIDGMEEIFSQTIESESERNAVTALCRDIISEIEVKYSRLGFIIFLRKDMARDSITVNFEQFHSLYHSFELKWSSTEALRLVLWIVSRAVPGFYAGEAALEMAPREVIDCNLHKLWGVKLGKPASNEANSSRWILAALSDFNGQLQARDMIRFLEKATAVSGKPVYDDRYLMPVEIKKAVSECSSEKISEIRQEIKALGPIFDKLENASAEKKVLPFYNDTFALTQAEEKVMKQEGYLRVENDRYYLPEIIRHALKFKYGKGARPKVLSLLLK